MVISKRLIWTLTSVIMAGTHVIGTVVASAEPLPKWFINGTKAGKSHTPILLYGNIKWEQKTSGNLECTILGAGSVWNEVAGGTEKGLESTEAFTTYNCTSEGKCKAENSQGEKVEGMSLSAEGPPKSVVRENGKTEKELVAKRVGNSTLPWRGEAVGPEGSSKLKIGNMKVYEVVPPSTGGGICPIEGLELPWEGQVEPMTENGKKNGLFPGDIKFEGKGGGTGFLTSSALPSMEEDNIAYLISTPYLTLTGQKEQLVNLEE